MDANLLDDIHIKDEENGKRNKWIIALVFIQLFSMPVSFVASIIEITSILTSGGIVAGLSVILFILALINKRNWLLAYSISSVASVLLVFFIIFIFELSPSKAREPVPWIILVFTLISTCFGIPALIREFRRN